ncbi:hypothetical protein MRX96_046668 [Rhipicephalus microplus]
MDTCYTAKRRERHLLFKQCEGDNSKRLIYCREISSINGFITDAWNLVIKSAKRLSLDLSVGIIVSKCFKCFVRITCAACEDASLA